MAWKTLAIPNTLTPTEQANLKSLVTALRGGRTLVVLGSRSGEGWLAQGTFGDNAHDLGGLDDEAATALVNAEINRQAAASDRV